MDTTIFLAEMWGPVLLAVGIGFFTSRKYYIRLYKDLEKETLALLIFGMAGIAGGIAHINFHNTWSTFPEIVISLLGWGILLKGLLFAIAPGWVDRAGDWEVDSKLVPFAGAFVFIAGSYITWFAYVG